MVNDVTITVRKTGLHGLAISVESDGSTSYFEVADLPKERQRQRMVNSASYSLLYEIQKQLTAVSTKP